MAKTKSVMGIDVTHRETEAEFRGFMKSEVRNIDMRLASLEQAIDNIRKQLTKHAYKLGGIATGISIITTIVMNQLGGPR